MWVKLKDASRWEPYQQELIRAQGLEGSLIAFGSGPNRYPCLAASLRTDATHFATAYVYEEDARELLGDKDKDKEAGAPALPASVLSQINDRFRWVAANLLTLAWVVTSLKLVSEDKYEEKLVEFLDKIPRWSDDDIALAEASKLERSLLGRLTDRQER